MKLSGYWVKKENGRVMIERTVFDETELDPKTDWKEAWQNSDTSVSIRGYVDKDRALSCASDWL